MDKICDQNNEILQILRARYSTDLLANRLYQNLDAYPIDSIEQFRHLDDEANKQERQTVVSLCTEFLNFLNNNFRLIICYIKMFSMTIKFG